MSKGDVLRVWQQTDGKQLFEMESLKTRAMVRVLRPNLVVQLEGMSYFEQFPSDGYFYHVAQDADRHSPLYSVEAQSDMLPFADHSVDLLVAGHALEMQQDHEKCLTEFARVLAHDGHLVLHAWAGYWLSASMPNILQPVTDLNLKYVSLTDMNVILKTLSLKVDEKTTWQASSDSLKILKQMKQKVIQPMSFVISREQLSFINSEVCRYE
ncbi:class I SAM-dependent methyltransferase [Gammaproteobacteria bacterium]|nr:class I SAM-dependent methyltransferase [Gammaproteobacteria bacterium]